MKRSGNGAFRKGWRRLEGCRTQLRTDRRTDEDVKPRFTCLALLNNCAYRSVWHVSTVGDFILRLREHHQALALEKKFDSEQDHIPLWMILAQTAQDTRDSSAIGGRSRSIINGSATDAALSTH